MWCFASLQLKITADPLQPFLCDNACFLKVWSKYLLLNWVTLHSVSRFCKVFQKHQSYLLFFKLESCWSKDKAFLQKQEQNKVFSTFENHSEKYTPLLVFSYFLLKSILCLSFPYFPELLSFGLKCAVSQCLGMLAWFLLSSKRWCVLLFLYTAICYTN